MNKPLRDFVPPHPAWASTPCIPFAGFGRRKGYGYTQFKGRQYLAHRLAFALNQGVRPEALGPLVVRHACDNRECVNVGHLLPGTAADNTADKVARGRHLKGDQISQAKLTPQQVIEIRALYAAGGTTQRRIAADFKVSQSAVSLLLSKSNWKHI